MNVFEKMLFLKSMTLFKRVKDEALLGLAAVLEEEAALPDIPILKKGEWGTTMYMIVSGKVKVHDDGTLIKEISDHDVFGELAALCPEKRVASVTTIEESLFLKISSNALYELIELQPELAKGIIEVLCARMRDMAKDLDNLRAHS
jgi:CRP/FNR family cyclic AMP-dependent transcriptional regulator